MSKDVFLDHRGWEDRQMKRMSLEAKQSNNGFAKTGMVCTGVILGLWLFVGFVQCISGP